MKKIFYLLSVLLLTAGASVQAQHNHSHEGTVHSKDFATMNKGGVSTAYEFERKAIGDNDILIFCHSGHARITSTLFHHEILCAGEVIFVSRGNEFSGVALSDVTLFIHKFNNTVCNVPLRASKLIQISTAV